MALSILKELLDGYVQSLFAEGVLNDQFSHILTLKRIRQPGYVVQLINTYFVDVETLLSEITAHSDLPDVEFSKLALLARKLQGFSSCIGAEHVRLACADLIQACDQKDRHTFSRSLTWMKSEFAQTRNKLEAIAQMELRIARVQSRQKN